MKKYRNFPPFCSEGTSWYKPQQDTTSRLWAHRHETMNTVCGNILYVEQYNVVEYLDTNIDPIDTHQYWKIGILVANDPLESPI